MIATLDTFLPPALRERVRRPTAEAVGLPRQLYISPEYFETERDLLLARTWVSVGLVQDLSKPGDARPFDLAGVPIILVRGQDSRIRAFHNVCSHRGVQLLTKEMRRPTIVCPYHAWTYALDGRLLATPKFCGAGGDTHDGFDRSRHGLKEIRCESWAGLLFVNLAGNAAPLAEYVAPLAERWRDYDLSLLRHGGGVPFEIKANWKLVIENFVERYHLPWVHPTLNSYSPIDETFQIVGDFPFVGVGSRSYDPKPVGDRRLPPFPGIAPENAKRAEYVALFPNVMLGCLYDHFYAFIVQPVAVDRTLERFEFFYVGDEAMAPEYAAARQDCIDRRKLINGEDIDIVERLQAGRRSPGMAGGVFSPVLEDTTHGFQRMVLEALAEGERSAHSGPLAAD